MTNIKNVRDILFFVKAAMIAVIALLFWEGKFEEMGKTLMAYAVLEMSFEDGKGFLEALSKHSISIAVMAILIGLALGSEVLVGAGAVEMMIAVVCDRINWK